MSLLTIAMVGVYVTLANAMRSARVGQGAAPFQDTRIAAGLMMRELRSVVPGSRHLIRGDGDEIEFYALTPPLHPDDGATPRIMWVRYDLKRQRDRTKQLIREEAIVEGTLPLDRAEGDDEDAITKVDLAKKRDFVVADGIETLQLSYLVYEEEPGAGAPDTAEVVVKELGALGETEPPPAAVRIALIMRDELLVEGESDFHTVVRLPESGLEGARRDRALGVRREEEDRRLRIGGDR